MAAGVDKGDLQHCGPADIIFGGWQQFLFESYGDCTIKIARVKKKHSTVPE